MVLVFTWQGSELAVPKTNSFFFFFLSQVYFWLECQYKGRDNTECLWVWWDGGSSDLDWAKLGQYFCSWGIGNTARIPTWQACSFFSSLFCFPNKTRLSYPYILSVCHSATSEFVSSFQPDLTKGCEVLKFCGNSWMGRERRQWGKDSCNLSSLPMPRSNSQLACQHTR